MKLPAFLQPRVLKQVLRAITSARYTTRHGPPRSVSRCTM